MFEARFYVDPDPSTWSCGWWEQILIKVFIVFVGIVSVDLSFVEEGVSPSQVKGQPTRCTASSVS